MKKKIIITSLLFCLMNVAEAQHQVRGTVYDNDTGEPLFCAIAKIKKTTIGCHTDSSGHYTINASPEDILVFEYLGYQTQEHPVGNRCVIDVHLQEDRYDLGLYEGPIGHMPYHFFGVYASYSGKKWGYGFDYMYAPGWAFPQNTWHKIINELGFGIRMTDVNPSDNWWTCYPYLSVQPINLFRGGRSWRTTYNYPYPFVDVGYYFDTDFKHIGAHNVGFGGGFRYDIRRIFRIKRFPNLTVTAGYSAFAGQSENNHFYIGLHIRPNARPILIY